MNVRQRVRIGLNNTYGTRPRINRIYRALWYAGNAIHNLRGGRATGNTLFWFGYMLFATIIGITYISFAFVFAFWVWALIGLLCLLFSLIGWYEMAEQRNR